MRTLIGGLALALLSSPPSIAAPPRIPATGLDHILVGAPDLDRAVADVERRTGVRAVYGGSHPGAGTRNALIALGNGAYLELIAPDPKQTKPSEFGNLKTITPLAWAYHTTDLSALRSELAAHGVHVKRIEPGSRRRPDGRTLHWRTFEIASDQDVAPFFIEWGRGSPHPSLSAAPGCRLVRFSVGGPLKPNIVHALALTGKSAVWQRSSAPGLHIALRCRGAVIRF